MKADDLQRAAYIAAHRILMADVSTPGLACPGTRRSRAVDAIAGIIKDVFDVAIAGEHHFGRDKHSADVVELPHTARVLQLPRRASS